MKTKKKYKQKKVIGIATFQNVIKGNIILKELDNFIEILVELEGLPKNSILGFHCHEAGDLSEKCDSCCSHFNPAFCDHGGLNCKNSHVGDFGNLKTDSNGSCFCKIISKKAKLRGKNSLIGRSLVIHADEDDLGLTNHPESKITGNAGKRIACSVIGYSKDSQLYF